MNAAAAIGEPVWLARARDFIGLSEIKGSLHSPEILRLWADAHMPQVHDDETAWCAAFVAAMLERSLITSPRKPNARSFCDWGIDVLELGREQVPLGAVVVFERPPNPAHGHVGFACGIDADGFIHVLGGNQSDKVCVARMRGDRLIASRWPTEARTDLRLLRRVPFVSTIRPISTNEA